MSLEEAIQNAYRESVSGIRRGDKTAEADEIRRYITHAQKIVVPNHNDDKVTVINEVLEGFGLRKAVHLRVPTDCCDLNRMPAVTKALMALDLADADLVVARGRLGVPGSGSMLVIMDRKGRLLSAALSPSHAVHHKTLADTVRSEMRTALERTGLSARHPGERPPENGITPTVKTYFSRCTVGGVIDRICAGKADAVLGWLDEQDVRPEKTLIVGSYLTGAALANRLGKTSSVTVADIHSHLRRLLDPSISFAPGVEALDRGGWDLVVDTSGLGGIEPDDLRRLDTPQAFLAEDPGSDGSDAALMHINRTGELMRTVPAQKKGVLCTDGLGTKTSGTMTLTVEVLRRSMQEASREEGVLYSTASMEFYERILFREQDLDAFLEGLKKPALVVSSLKEIDCDGIIERTFSTLGSRVVTWCGEKNEGKPAVQEDR